MELDQYLESLENGSGHLNPFDVKTKTTSPDYAGFIKIKDEIYRVSCWIKIRKKDKKKFLSLKAIPIEYYQTLEP